MKKIAHICLLGTVTPGGSYNENLLSKYHARMGFDTFVICSRWQQNTTGGHKMHPQTSYTNENGVHVRRLSMIGRETPYKKFKLFKNLTHTLEEIKPDILFIHGCQTLHVFTIISYIKKYPDVKVYVDNHADFSNSARNWLSKTVLHKLLWRFCAHSIEPYTTKFYGVLPARVDFLKNIYKLPAEKCELLLMGADDDLVAKASLPEVRCSIRQKYGIEEDDFLIVSGGKFNSTKRQILFLAQAVHNMTNPKVKLLIFGPISKELKPAVDQFCDGKKIQEIGFIKGEDSYQYFAAADLVCFPGRHSVFWEQVTGQGIPMLVKDWPGTHHVDVGGNVRFLTQDSAEEMQQAIEFLLSHPDAYHAMKKIAQQNGMKYFSYKEIAKQSIEIGD